MAGVWDFGDAAMAAVQGHAQRKLEREAQAALLRHQEEMLRKQLEAQAELAKQEREQRAFEHEENLWATGLQMDENKRRFDEQMRYQRERDEQADFRAEEALWAQGLVADKEYEVAMKNANAYSRMAEAQAAANAPVRITGADLQSLGFDVPDDFVYNGKPNNLAAMMSLGTLLDQREYRGDDIPSSTIALEDQIMGRDPNVVRDSSDPAILRQDATAFMTRVSNLRSDLDRFAKNPSPALQAQITTDLQVLTRASSDIGRRFGAYKQDYSNEAKQRAIDRVSKGEGAGRTGFLEMGRDITRDTQKAGTAPDSLMDAIVRGQVEFAKLAQLALNYGINPFTQQPAQ
jgi:hypothetical protein